MWDIEKMTEFDIFVMFIHYTHECDPLWVLVFNLRILPVMSQPPNPAFPLVRGNQRLLCIVVLPPQEEWYQTYGACQWFYIKKMNNLRIISNVFRISLCPDFNVAMISNRVHTKKQASPLNFHPT